MIVPQISLEEAWETLSQDKESVLVDVRTTAEWAFAGIPDLSALRKDVRFVEWIRFPNGERNESFLADVTDGLKKDQVVLLLCRSGARSNAAAAMMAEEGYEVANIGSGFEGDLTPGGHRHGGWKDALPWVQS